MKGRVSKFEILPMRLGVSSNSPTEAADTDISSPLKSVLEGLVCPFWRLNLLESTTSGCQSLT